MELLIRDFNILRLIKALHDIEKIKDLILNDSEKEIFDCLPGPIILTNSNVKLQSNPCYFYSINKINLYA